MFVRLPLSAVLCSVVLAACVPTPGTDDPTHTDPGTDSGGESADSGNGGILPGDSGHDDTAGGGETGGGDTDSGDTDEPGAAPVRFIALGDGGHGNPEQYAVAAGIGRVCASNGCDFAIYLGDNIYDDGVSSVDDPQFEEKFEAPYNDLDFPFYMALGNHDWNSGPEGAYAQVEYTARSTKWTMPAQYYNYTQGDVEFFVVDSQPIRDGDTGPQQAWIDEAMASSTANWKIAYGHHPYISNGDHGDTGGDFGAFFDRNFCGKLDIYFAGHDHDLQWLEPQCGTEFIISGAASSLRDTGMGSNPTFYETSTLGFMWVEIAGNTMTGVFYDQDGLELYRRVVQK